MKRRTFLILAGFVATSWLGFEVGKLASTRVRPTAETQISEAFEESTSIEISIEPVIGIASLTNDELVRMVRDVGGIPIVLPCTDGSAEKIDEYLELVDGLLMPGGRDIPPSEWGEEAHPTTNVLDDERFRFEKALIGAWINRTDKPLLGICLGSQWVNVAQGGSLVQDIPSALGVNHSGTMHSVILDPESRLSEIFGETQFEVNSNHHQAVGDLGQGLRIVARSPDGVVEALETTDPDRFLIGVQWHPERMTESKLQTKLFEAFVSACAEQSRKPHPIQSN